MADKDDLSSKLDKFLGGRKVLIVDEANTVRGAMANVFGQLKVPAARIISASSYDDAAGRLKEWESIGLLITDYVLGKRSGVEFATELFSNQTDLTKVISIILTASAHQSHVVEAAEGLVDAFILKPFSTQALKEYFSKSLDKKLKPGDYERTLTEIRSKIWSEDYTGAIANIEATLTLKPPSKPTALFVYAGQSHAKLGKTKESIAYFTKALQIQKNHYMALAGTYEGYLKLKDKPSAYKYISQLSNLFPLSPQRLCEAIILCVETKNFDEIEKYYQMFVASDESRQDLIKTMAAALVVGAVHNFQQGDETRAVELFRKAIITSRRSEKIIERAVLYCLAYGKADTAKEYLGKFEAVDYEKLPYRSCFFLVTDLRGNAKAIEENLPLGVKITQEKGCPIQVFRAVLKRCKESKKDKLYATIQSLAIQSFDQASLDKPPYEISEKPESL